MMLAVTAETVGTSLANLMQCVQLCAPSVISPVVDRACEWSGKRSGAGRKSDGAYAGGRGAGSGLNRPLTARSNLTFHFATYL